MKAAAGLSAPGLTSEGRLAQKRIVYKTIAQGRASSRADVARHLELRPSTVSAIVADLLDAGLIVEASGRSSGRGRPASLLIGNPQALTVLVFQVVSQAIRATLMDLGGRVLLAEVQDVDGNCTNDGMHAVIKCLLERCLGSLPRGSEVAGLAFSLPGVLDVERESWLFSSRWPQLRNFDIGAVPRERGLTLSVRRNLDAELQARLLSHPDWTDGTLLLHWGYGIGVAYGIKGSVVNMSEGRFGEIGHWRLHRASEKVCRCGSYGCLETIAGLWALHPVLDETFTRAPLNEADLAEAAPVLDLLAVEDVETALAAVVDSVANLCRILFPRRVIVSGPFVANPALWSAFNDRFAAEGVLVGVPLPALIIDQRSEPLEREGAGRPLLEAALAARLGW